MALWKYGQDPDADKVTVNLGIVGRGASGKTSMLTAIQKLVLYHHLIPGLEFSARNVDDLKRTADDVSKATETFRSGPAERTTAAGHFRYCLYHGASELMSFVYRDAIGQLLHRHSGQYGKEDKAAHDDFVAAIAKADVIWVIIPLYKKGNDIDIDDSEMVISQGYVRDALKERDENNKISIALVLTKADLAGSEGSAQTNATLNRLSQKAARRFATMVSNTNTVWACSAFPVSAYGMDLSEELKLETARPGTHSLLTAEEMNPWNVDKLLLWSLVCGLEQPKKRRSPDGRELQIARQISPVITRHDGPEMLIKSFQG